MAEALIVLERAKREAQARLAKADMHKRATIGHAIAELDWAIEAFKYIYDQRNTMRQLQTEMELANVQKIHNSSLPRRGATGNNRRHGRSK